MARRIPFATSVEAWREAKELIEIPRRRVWIVSILGAGVGLSETAFLTIIASVGVAITGKSGNAAIKLPFGKIDGFSVAQLIAAGVVLGLITMAASFLIQVQLARLSWYTVSTLRRELYADFTETSWPTQRGEVESALLAYIINHIPKVSNLLTSIIGQMTSAITLIVFLGAAVVIAPFVAVIVIILGVALYFAFLPMRGLASRAGLESRAATHTLFKSFADSVAASREIKAYGVAGPVRERINEEINDLEKPAYRLKLIGGFLPILYQRFVFMIMLGGLGIVYALDLKNIGAIGAALLIVFRAMQQAQAVQAAEPAIAESRPWISELKNRRDSYRSAVFHFGDTQMEGVEEIEFESVSYRYNVEGAPLALDNVSFTARRGELVGVIGPSGSGKSTLTELVLRLDRPTSGEYRVNGRATWDYDEKSWARQVVLVPQFSHLIAGSVEDNIRFLREGVTREAVEDAARRAHLTEEIGELDDGFETMIGERGYRGVSGGQRQRLSIARAVALPPSLIVLDEPTSALDHQAEDVIVETIERLREHACVIVVAHRLSTLRHCDRVLVLRDGKREAYCTLDELADRSEFFREARATNAL